VFWSLADGSVRAFERTHGGDQISAMFFDADGRLVTAGYDGQVIRWTLNEDSLTPSQQSLYKGRQILQMETSPNGAFVALCELSPAPTAVPGAQPNSRRPSLLQFNILDASGKLLKKLSEIEVPVATPTLPFETGFAWSADGARLLVVSGGKLTFRKTADWSVEKSFVVERTSNSQRNANAESVEKQRPARAAFSPSSSNLLATLNQREAHLWDIEKNTHLAEFRTHHSRRLTASWSADQRLMLTASDAIRVFDADPASPNRGQTLLRIPVSSGDSPLAYARFSPVPGDLRFLSGNEAGNVLLYRCTNTGALEGSPVPFPAAENNPLPEAAAALASLRFPSSARWSGDGKLCALIRNGELSCWKTDEQTPQPIPIKNPEGFPPLRCNDLVIAKDGDSLLLAAAGLAWIDDSDQLLPAAAFWKLNAQNEFVQVGLLLDDKRHFGDQQALDDVEQDLPPGITAIGFDSLSRTIFTGGRDGRVFEWAAGDFTSDQPTREFLGLSKEANAADVKRGENLFTRVISLQVAADGRLIAADSTGNILIWPPVPK
jgi:WD40 repeat protein